MKYLVTTVLSLFIFFSVTSCSEKDKGLRYSDNYNEQLNKNKPTQSKISGGCSFSDIDYEPSSEPYSNSTENIITELLVKYVTPLQPQNSLSLSGQVNYLAWLTNSNDKIKLCTVIDHFKNTNLASLIGEAKKVFYINAYNILTIELILKNYKSLDKGVDRDRETFPEQKSIKNIDSLGDKVWDGFAWNIGNKNYTLNQIEKNILIPLKDARVHFAINCASKGCPPLRNEAFTVGKLESQLDEMSTFFVSSPAYNFFELFNDIYIPDSGDNFYELSSIFDWYALDFSNDSSGRYGSVRSFIVYHLNASNEELGFPKKDLLNSNYWEEEYGIYNWELNEVVN